MAGEPEWGTASLASDMKVRFILLLLAALLVAGAVVVRVWLAASGGYSQGGPALPLRVGSAVALVGGLLLVGAMVAWPMQRPGGPTGRRSGPDSE